MDAMILRDAAKGKVALSPARTAGHAWAYLPDLAEAFAALAEQRDAFGAFETFHFAGHYVTANETFAAIEKAAGRKLTQVDFPWTTLKLAGLVMPLLREVVKMRYLWDNPMALRDDRLAALLGPEFGTAYEDAIAGTVSPILRLESEDDGATS